MITEIYLENFKCHKKIELKGLRPLTIITGPNNSGKSAILQGITFIRDWIINDAVSKIHEMNHFHSFEDMVYQKVIDNTIRIGIGIEAENFSEEQIREMNRLNFPPSTINQEFKQIIWKFSFNKDFNLNTKPHELIINDTTAFYIESPSSSQEMEEMAVTQPILLGSFRIPFTGQSYGNLNTENFVYSFSKKFQDQIESFFYFLPTRGLNVWNSPLSWTSDVLTIDGQNVGTFITYLFNQRSELFEELEFWIKKFDPSIQSLRTGLVKESRLDLVDENARMYDVSSIIELKDQDVYKHLLTYGSGLISVLPIITQLIVCPSGSVVFIEEPEIHLHHGAIEVLLDLFIDSIKKGKQIILTTHSIDLLNSVFEAFRREPELKDNIIRYDIKRDIDSHLPVVTRIQPSSEFKVWSQGFKSILKEKPE